MHQEQPNSPGLRIDRWLWRARLYKTRSLAARAVQGGLVHVNGERVKSARAVRVGDCLEITHASGNYRLTVLGIPQRRGPAAEAVGFYRTNELVPKTGRRRRSADGPTGVDAPPRRPDKKNRRRLRALKGRL